MPKSTPFTKPAIFIRCGLLTLAAALAVFFLAATALPARSQAPADVNYGLTPGEGFGEVDIGQSNDLYGTIARVINIALGFLGIVAVILILYAGFLWMTARGNEDQVGKAKKLLRNAVIGLAIILSAWGIAAFVISRLSDATGGDGSGDGSGGGGLGGGLPAERFTLQEFQTGHAGRTNRDDVFRCSAVQTRFNHWLNNTSVATERANLKALIIGADSAHNGNYQPIAESQMAVDINSSGNVIAYRRAPADSASERENWPPYSQIEIRVPKNITDTSNESIADCTALGCNDRGDHYAWQFTTTDKTDAINPTLMSAYPRLPGSPEGYPDRNVDRSITFVLNFSEAIDYFSVVRSGDDNRLDPAHVKVEQITSDTDPTVVASIPTEHFDASLSEIGVRFALNNDHQSAANDGPYLEPFAWYQITVKDVLDLCGNPLSATNSEVAWIFQTNGNIPGVEFTYPAAGYQYACPNTEAFVQFRTSMYEIRTSSCAVDPTIGGLVVSGSGVAGRNLAAHDNLPTTGVVNPNNFCKRYDFAPPTVELAPNTTYNPSVDYRNPANDSLTVNQSWSFAVKPANECANAPYVSRIDPGTGPFGRCLTIQGNYFGTTKIPSDDAYMTLDLESARNAIAADAVGQAIRSAWTTLNNSGGIPAAISASNWLDTYLTGVVPEPDNTPAQPLPPGTGGLADFKFSVKHSVVLGGQPQVLRSNEVNFTAELSGSYTGPCLSAINPASGAWLAPVALTGTNFGTRGDVTFTNQTFPASVTDWRNTSIQSSVPNSSQDGLVHVATPQGLSNGLWFDVANGRGAACSVDGDCTPPLVCSGGICADPPTPRGFYITQVWPRQDCNGACLNAEISLSANSAIRRSNAAASLAIYKCLDQACQNMETAGQSVSIGAYRDDGRTVVLNSSLALNSSYRVVVAAGASGLLPAFGSELLSQLNFDNNRDGTLDSYSWYFRTGARACAVERLEMDRSNLTLYENESADLLVRPYGPVDSCSTQGQLLTVATGFTWKHCAYLTGDISAECRADCPAPVSGSAAILVVNTPDPNDQRQNSVSAVTGTSAGLHGLACVLYGTNAKKAGSDVTVRSRCQDDKDCVLSGVCPGSICNRTGANAGRCTPVINNFSPTTGQISTWVTVNGCYFGSTPGRVLYDGRGEPIPFVLLGPSCGQTWTDRQIIAEVPSGAPRVGQILVDKAGREDGQIARNSSLYFSVRDDEIHPGLCRANPNYGASNNTISLVGKNFGATRDLASDKVLFGATEALNVINWADVAPMAIIQVAVPNMATGTAPIIVRKGAIDSNPISFRVIDSPGAVAPPGGASQDLTVSAYTPGSGVQACPAMIIEVVLEGTLNQASAPGNFLVKEQGADESLPGEVFIRNINGRQTRLSFAPTANLDFGSAYSIILKGGDSGLRSQSNGRLIASARCAGGALSAGGECVINFNVISNSDTFAVAQCLPGAMTIDPASPLYTCAGKNNCQDDYNNTTPGHQRNFSARVLARNGQPLHIDANRYIWTIGDETILGWHPTRGEDQDQVLTVLPKNGTTRVGVEVTIASKKFSAATRAQVFLCANPWPPYPQTPFQDVEGAGFTTQGSYSNFSTFYCRDQGQPGTADDLPELVQSGEFTSRQSAVSEDFIKEIFLTQPYSKKCETGGQACSQASDCMSAAACVGKTDAIGIRVLKNPNHDTTSEWYKYQSFIKGSPQAVAVDDYNGLRDGRTIYVNAPNDADGEGGAGRNKIFTNIYLISMNDQAQPDTQNIFNQLAANWRFAANIEDPANLDKLRRDTQRLADLRHLADLVETYANNRGAPPKLESGSYTKHLSVSVWPSWSASLASDLGATLPIDPLNTVDGPACVRAGAADGTCWNKTTKIFECAAGSYVYQYQYDSSITPFFTLRANLEYQPSSWAMPAGSWYLTGAVNSCENLRYGVNSP